MAATRASVQPRRGVLLGQRCRAPYAAGTRAYTGCICMRLRRHALIIDKGHHRQQLGLHCCKCRRARAWDARPAALAPSLMTLANGLSMKPSAGLMLATCASSTIHVPRAAC